MLRITSLIVIGLAFTPSLATAAPSFDCRKAAKADELAICANPQLAANDDLTTKAFGEAKVKNRTKALAVARSFLRVRSACGSDKDCIAEAQTQAVLDFSLLGASLPGGKSTSSTAPSVAPSHSFQTETTGAADAVGDVAKPEWREAYKRRIYQLGMTLKAFRVAAYPDEDRTPGAFPVCSNDMKAEELGYYEARVYSDAYKRAGIIKCQYFWTTRIGTLDQVLSAGIILGDANVSTEFYFIRPDNDRDHRLAWIHTQGPTEMFATILPAFQKAYGPPASSTVVKWQNKAGATFDNDVVEWRNSVSSIVFKRLGDTINKFDLRHEMTPLMQVFAERLDLQTDASADKL